MKRAILAAFLCAVVLAIAAPPHGSSAAGFSGSGSGTAENPYIITTVEQLQEMRNDLAAHYALGNNIDASGTVNWNGGAGFEPVGTWDNEFTGSFDGRGYKIYDLHIDRSGTNYVGLFGCVGGVSVVENVGLESVNVVGSRYVGGLVGYNSGTVSNSYSTGSVSGNYLVGGLVGHNSYTVSDSYSTGSVTGIVNVGGLVGWHVGTVSNSYSTGPVSGSSFVGGLVGHNSGGTVSDSYSTGSVVGGDGGHVGGLVGYNFGIVSNSHSTGPVSCTSDVLPGGVGGLVGVNSGPVSNSYSTGPVTGSIATGGLVEINMKPNPGPDDTVFSISTPGGMSHLEATPLPKEETKAK